MARNFRRHRAAHPIADLNVTNLIDLGFILLVIFMIATPLIQQDQTIPVQVPTVAKAPQTKVDPKERFIAVGVSTKGFYVGNRATPLTLAEVRERLRAFAAEPKPPVIRILGDASVPYQKVAELFTEVQKAGLTRFNFDTQTESR
ncbi:MAG: biopolymer transporter ExbD [Opitutaceae bacterium]|nr:biopolymer transporter ExbD [Opitutaceae bacterium]